MARVSRKQQRLAEYKKLAKKADAQLRTLERYIRLANTTVYETKVNKKTGKKTKVISKKYEKYKILEEYAYGTAMQDIKALYGGGKRFDRTAKGLSLAELNERINAIESFLSKPSAYVRSTKEHESISAAWKRSAKAFSEEVTNRLRKSGTIGEKEKINLSPEDIKDLVNEAQNYGLYEEGLTKYEIIEALKEVQDDASLLEAIKKIKDQKKYERINADNEDAFATEVKDKLKELGVSKETSQTLTKMSAMGIDFSRFRRI